MNTVFRTLIILVAAGLLAYVFARVLWRSPRSQVRETVRVSEQVSSSEVSLPKPTPSRAKDPRAVPSPQRVTASSAQAMRKAEEVTSPPTLAGQRLLKVRLQVPHQATLGAFEARIGIAEVEAEAAFDDVPQAIETLTNIRAWLPANVSSTDGRVAIVGPVEVPAAEAYDVLAWNHEARLYYYRRYHPPAEENTTTVLDVGELPPQPYTGVRMYVAGEAEFTTVRAIAERILPPDPEPASAILGLVRVMAPELGESLYNGEPIQLPIGMETVLAPLAPDAGLRLTFLSPADVESTPVEIALKEGEIVNVSLTLDELFPAGANATLTLHGRLIASDTREPLAGTTVRRPHGLGFDEWMTDAEGTFVIADLPMNSPVALEVVTTSGVSAQPRFPQLWRFEFSPPVATTGTVVQRTWEVPTLSWLVLDLGEWSTGGLRNLASSPYPIYFLERRHEESGRWRSVRSDHYLESEKEVSIAIEEPGTYRAGVALSPTALWYSEPVQVGKAATRAFRSRIQGEFPRSQSFLVEVQDAVTARPISDALVVVSGPHASLPPQRLRTNHRGIVEIQVANTTECALVAVAQGYEEREVTQHFGDPSNALVIKLLRKSE
ncbi:hypothetical protein BRCON_2591 [Candidatus Sumerlaea chitinivorans]|uniref:Carboxypeptidase regulatory-like domain-containing protein n=1 Tax=Sumerlaea chitinivorans TaxID=2250252 RepID=A0A2Z4YA72_SUMC1|nr:hypothetical protein BRCON_2591 [Candidatus Sumerlaea chitinivorans]